MYMAPPLGVTPLEFHCDLWLQSPWAIARRCLRDPTFGRFDRTQTFDGRPDTGPYIAYTVLA